MKYPPDFFDCPDWIPEDELLAFHVVNNASMQGNQKEVKDREIPQDLKL